MGIKHTHTHPDDRGNHFVPSPTITTTPTATTTTTTTTTYNNHNHRNESKSISLLHHDHDITTTTTTRPSTTTTNTASILSSSSRPSILRQRVRHTRLWMAASLSSIPLIGNYIYTTFFVTILATLFFAALLSPKYHIPHVKVAMIGNSMMYYNDFPRFMEELSDGHVTQNSCLHGNANFRTILQMGVRP